jgi:lipopolysaccharide/colanic/teichoic acid biosynthesis glycosyltransferase
MQILERLLALLGLIALAPVLLVIALAVVVSDGLPVIFRQTRIGRNGRPFMMYKFRSMRNSAPGAAITASGDARITRVGSILRRFKLDEFPQLFNVLKGDMSLIGPRPELPKFVDLTDPVWQAVLRARPGITDVATLAFRNEEELLATAADPEQFYREAVLPRKLALNRDYIDARSPISDLRLLFMTLRFSFAPAGHDPERILHAFGMRSRT